MEIRITSPCLDDDIPDSEIACPICGSRKVVPIYYMGLGGLPGAQMNSMMKRFLPIVAVVLLAAGMAFGYFGSTSLLIAGLFSPFGILVMSHDKQQQISAWWLVIAAFFAPTSYGVDFESGVRNVQRHQNWQSMEFKNQYGLFLSARASTEDKRKRATLNITIAPEKGQCDEAIELLLKLDMPAKENVDRDGLVEFQFDNSSPRLFATKIVIEKGDSFVFMRISDRFSASDFEEHQSMLANARGWGIAEFSFLGFDEALRKARNSCRAFLTDDNSSLTLAQHLEATKECYGTECTFRAGKDLKFTITGLGGTAGGVTFERSFSEGDYYASIGLHHGCVIVHNGDARPPVFKEIAFVSPYTAKVYSSWQECRGK